MTSTYGSPAPSKATMGLTGKHIVILNEGVPVEDILNKLEGATDVSIMTSRIGFSGVFSESALSFMRASPDVETISEDYWAVMDMYF